MLVVFSVQLVGRHTMWNLQTAMLLVLVSCDWQAVLVSCWTEATTQLIQLYYPQYMQ